MTSLLRHTPIIPAPEASRSRNKDSPGSLRVGAVNAHGENSLSFASFATNVFATLDGNR